MFSGVVPHYWPGLLVCCLTIGHTFWFGASLSAMPSDVVPCYQPCLLVWCLVISHAFWCGASLSAMSAGVVLTLGHTFWFGASLSAMHVGVVPHYRPCLLSWYLTIGHVCWCVAHLRPYLLVWCLVIGHACWCCSSLQTMPVGVVPHYRPCLLVNCHCHRHFTSRVQLEGEWLHV